MPLQASRIALQDGGQVDLVADEEGDAGSSITIIHYPGWPGKSEILRLFPVGPNCAKIVFGGDDGRPLANVEQVGRETPLLSWVLWSIIWTGRRCQRNVPYTIILYLLGGGS